MKVDMAHRSEAAQRRLALAKWMGMTKLCLVKVGELARLDALYERLVCAVVHRNWRRRPFV